MKVKPARQNISTLHKSEHHKNAGGASFASRLQQNAPLQPDQEQPPSRPQQRQDGEHIGKSLHKIADALEAISSCRETSPHSTEHLDRVFQHIEEINNHHPLIQDAKALIITEIARLKRQEY